MGEPRFRLTGIADYAIGGSPDRPGRHPFWTSSFYSEDSWWNANGELVLEWRPVPELTATLDVGGGNNFIATQAIGLNHGQPFDIPQVFLEWCPNLLCIGAGRRGDRSGAETWRTDLRLFPTASPNYSISPFTQTVGEVGLVGDNATVRFAVSPGPDRFLDNNSIPFFLGYFTFNTSENFSLFLDWQGGPDQDGNNDRWRHFGDFGVTFGTGDPVRFMLYGMFGTEETEEGWQNWAGANAYLHIRPPGAPVAVNLRLGYTYDDGVRTGVEGLDLLQLSGGFTFYPLDNFQIRLHGDLLGAVGTSPFDGEQSLLGRVFVQAVYVPSSEVE